MRKLLILSLTLNLAVVLFFIGKRVYWSYFKNPETYTYTVEDYMKATAEIQNSLPVNEGDTVFVGDSHTAHFPLTEMFGYKNRGIGSNQTIHILNRIKPIAQGRPSVIFLEGGYNDMSAGKPVSVPFNNWLQILSIIKQESPSTRVIVQSVFPVCKESLKFMPQVDSLNMLLKQHCGINNIEFLDLHHVFRKGNGLDSTLTWDGIHLNAEGYRRWKGEIEKVL